MNKVDFKDKLLKIITRLFDTRAAAVYILIFAASIGIATFVENDFGTSAAQKVIFKSKWFELLLLLFAITIIVNIVKFRMIANKKWALLLFHSAMIIILIGAAVTRYTGFEGMMHIRENDKSNTFLSADSYIVFDVISGKQRFKFDEPVLFASLGNNNWEKEFQLDNLLLNMKVKQFIPNPVEELIESESGLPMIKIVLGSSSGRQEYYLTQGDSKNIRGLIFNFTGQRIPNAVNINFSNDQLTIEYDKVLNQTVMATQKTDTLHPNVGPHVLRLRSLYTDGINSFVFGDFNTSAILELNSSDIKVKNESLKAIVADVTVHGETQEVVLYGRKGSQGQPAILKFNKSNTSIALSYGSKELELPFEIKLYDFIMEKYPGTNSAASYASEVQLIDSKNNVAKDFRIYMNHILDYGGYRFFQSSFDKDELGTYLSVNNDFWGTWISYLGYFILTLGMIMVFISKGSRFSQIRKALNNMRKSSLVILFFFISIFNINSQKKIEATVNRIDKDHAQLFSTVIVQDHKGRMKPIHTLSRELLRKVYRNEKFNGLNADQVVLSMFADRANWMNVPLIKLGKSEAVKSKLSVMGDFASYSDFFDTSGQYKLKNEVRRAYGLQPIDRGVVEKEFMKIDERLNIVNMIFSGSIFKVIPIPGHENNKWVASNSNHIESESSPVADKFFPSYQNSLQSALKDNNYTLPNQIIDELKAYQLLNGKEVMPSSVQSKLEILLNKLNVFGRLSVYYLILGVIFLSLLFFTVFNPSSDVQKLLKYLTVAVALCFAFHTLGLGIRWYVSERAPWSNGYESMIYIAWTTALAGLIFTRKSLGGLASTMILAGTILLVAKLSYLDPEITPLVPVLKSYWLTIHVSLIAGSYGFLMLGAIIGLINLILFMFLTQNNKTNIKRIVKEMSYISEITLIGGLIMISIGTYLGGVWANESWGRYWGWDAKETWALVTILVYAFILHMRLIPKLNDLYNYNLAKLFGWASVVMTYFGVNYYLSGLHSYAAGDPIPIPNWVYIAIASCTLISLIALYKYKKLMKF